MMERKKRNDKHKIRETQIFYARDKIAHANEESRLIIIRTKKFNISKKYIIQENYI